MVAALANDAFVAYVTAGGQTELIVRKTRGLGNSKNSATDCEWLVDKIIETCRRRLKNTMMNESKKARLEKKGWRVGSAQEFLNLSKQESQFIELKLRLSHALKDKRQESGLTQAEAARILLSSQSRLAKMEVGDPSVSMDLLIRALLTMGTTTRELGRLVSSPQRESSA